MLTFKKPLKEQLSFPLTVYLKYNGFLGLLGYDSFTNKLVFCSKSRIGGDFALWFENIFRAKYEDKIEEITKYCKEFGTSLTFEVIDNDNDKHIIEYDKSFVILLDVFKRKVAPEKLDFGELRAFGCSLGMDFKQRVGGLDTYDEFLDFLEKWKDIEAKHEDKYVEGFVIEDKQGEMLKVKTAYYSFWKHMRHVKDSVAARRPVNLSALQTPLANNFYGWCGKQDAEFLKQPIVDVRKQFLKNV